MCINNLIETVTAILGVVLVGILIQIGLITTTNMDKHYKEVHDECIQTIGANTLRPIMVSDDLTAEQVASVVKYNTRVRRINHDFTNTLNTLGEYSVMNSVCFENKKILMELL